MAGILACSATRDLRYIAAIDPGGRQGTAMRFDGQVFTSDVTLDYNEFVDCEFRDCVVMYYGGDFSLVRTRMLNVRFGLGGAANLTLGFLRLVRAHGPELLDQLLDAADPLKPGQSISIN